MDEHSAVMNRHSNYFKMKRFLFFTLICVILSTPILAQGMSDSQVIDFIKREAKAGTSQAQIVTKLVQRGVKIDQIRRLRNQYDKQLKDNGLQKTADKAEGMAAERMRTNNDGTTEQDLTTAKVGTTGEMKTNASDDVARMENDIQATSEVSNGTAKKVFGRDIFNKQLLSFEPNMNIATPQNYVLGPGDQVIVDVYGASQRSLQLTVSPDGTITVPGYGPITVGGLTVAGAQSKLRASLGSRYASSELRVTVGQTRTIMVNVMGEVKAPGTFHLSAFASVFHALYMAGGINDLGTLRNIKVFRNGRLITIVDIYEYILNGRLAGNVMLQDNDMIIVGAYDCLVGITGNVKRPMFYEMRHNESVATLIKYAGGFTGDAYTRSVRVIRQAERYAVYNVSEFEQSSFKVNDGDAVTVDGILNRYENMVEVKGAVFRPGMYHLGQDITSVRSLIEHAEGITEDAYASHGVIHRLNPDRSSKVISIDIQGIMDGTTPDIPLMNEDVLFVPTQEELRKNRILTITGEVMSPGDYEYADSTTIEDLIIQAGGLQDGASLARVDVSRRIKDLMSTEKTDKIAETFRFDIRDGLVINKGRHFHLQPYDVVHVRRSPGFVMPRNISIHGEVNFEGDFTIERKNVRLSDAIAMAGGVTQDAYLRGARLERKMNDVERQRMETTLFTIKNMLNERGDSVAVERLNIGDSYQVGIELDKALANPGCDNDILLREGDEIIVPEYNGTVKISGDVMFPNTVTYEKGRDWKWYVNQAGGWGVHAKKSRSFIVYQNGTISKAKKGEVEPGCEILVPSKKRHEPMQIAQMLQLGTSAITMTAMIAYLINAIK